MRIFTQKSELVETIHVYINAITSCINGHLLKGDLPLHLGSYHGFDKYSDLDVLKEVMISMTNYFELIPDGVFRMPTQEEIEDRIYDGEDDEE